MPRAASHVLLLLLTASCGRESPPDFLLVTVDTLRQDFVSTYGYGRETTPAIDSVGDAGAVFERHYSVMSHTGPAHTSLFSGLHPRAHGVRSNGTAVPAAAPWLAAELRHAGYHTAAFVGAALLSAEKGYGRGFEHFDEEIDTRDQHTRTYRRTAEEVVDRAIAHIAPPRAEPLFVWVHLYDPHAPYEQRPGFEVDSRAERDFFAARAEPSRFVSVDEIVSSQALYESGVRYADHHIGRLLAAWDATERGRAGLVVVTADHGEGLGEHRYMGHGFSNYEEQLLVPLVLRFAGRVPAGQRVAAATSFVDVAATCLDLLGIDRGGRFPGTPLLDAEGRPHAQGSGRVLGERRTFSDEELDRRGHIAALLEALAGQPGITRGDQISLLRGEWKYIWSEDAPDELYNIARDPAEKENVLERAPGELAQRLAAEIEAWKASSEARALRADEADDEETRRMLDALGY